MANKVEKDIENYLVKRATEINALVRKCQWVGHNNCPDRLLMHVSGTYWVEVKAPGKTPRPGQLREHSRMRKAGQNVLTASNYVEVDEIINSIQKG